MSDPERTCVGCREATDADDLVRLVADPEGGVAVDLRGRLPGRGAWVHVRDACLVSSVKQLSRALKQQVDATNVPRDVRDAVLRALADGVTMATAGGALMGGRTVVDEMIAAGRAVEVVVAADAAERTVRDMDLSRLPEGRHAPVVTRVPLTTDELGRMTGRGPRALLVVLDHPAAQHLRRQLRRLRSLG
jgi:predicted RNA-binding protein YlxR (DUF448 family)